MAAEREGGLFGGEDLPGEGPWSLGAVGRWAEGSLGPGLFFNQGPFSYQ